MPRRPVRDARSLPAAAQEEKRRTAIQLRKERQTFAAIAETLGVSAVAVQGWWKRYERGGLAALTAQTRGRRDGTQRTLTPAQERTVRTLVADKTPDQLKMPFALWTRAAIGALIQAKFGIRMPVRTIGHYLKRWGFTPRGKTPVLTVVSRRKSVSFLSTVTNQGKVRFMVLEGPLSAQILIRFLRRLIRDTNRRVFVILDNLNVHKAATVRAWVAAHCDAIELFYLPPYAPELNPDEYLNGDLKLGVAKRAPARTKPELFNVARSHLRMLQRRPARVRRFFEHPRVSYAA